MAPPRSTPLASPDAPGGADTQMPPAGGEGELLIYWVDTEGGAATVMRAPTGEIMIVDTGFPGTRDAARVVSVLQNELKATKVDYLLTTHYDADHTGGVGYIASRFPVGEFLDHGDGGMPASYRSAVGNGKRRAIQPGETLMLGPVKIQFVSSARRLIAQPLPGVASAPNPHCAGADQGSGNDENAASVGLVASWGNFQIVNLGDLLWPLEHDLACPVNKLGQVELYQTTHHGQTQSGAPQLIHAMAPLVAVMNNGAGKGGAATSMRNLARSPGFQDLWQVHRSNSAGADNTADERIANSAGRRSGPLAEGQRARRRQLHAAEPAQHAHEDVPVALSDHGFGGRSPAASAWISAAGSARLYSTSSSSRPPRVSSVLVTGSRLLPQPMHRGMLPLTIAPV